MEVLDFCRNKLKFQLYAYCILPNHIHLLILPNRKSNISEIMHSIKGNFAVKYMRSQNHKGSVAEKRNNKIFVAEKRNSKISVAEKRNSKISVAENKNNPTSADEPSWFARKRVRINPIWQKSFYDKAIRSDKELDNVINYINNNAIKHNLVDDVIKMAIFFIS